jgi:hypothetical protein
MTSLRVITFEELARITHEANRTYCQALGDDSQLHWDNAPEWQRESALAGVKFTSSTRTRATPPRMSRGSSRSAPTAGDTGQ